jgi:Cellulase (glycosyl hydrolase family 5)
MGSRRTTVAGVAALVLLAAGALASPTFAQRKMDIGVQDDNIFLFPYGLYNVDRAYAQARAFGASSVRFNVIWGEYDRFCRRYKGNCFKPYDDAVAAALRNGFRVQMTIAGTPQYDPGYSQYISYLRPNSARFRVFAARVARRYKGKVFRYSIWNEPNLARWITPSAKAPQYYARLVKAAYPAIKRVDRRNQVLIGELTSASRPLDFLVRMGGGIRADGLAYHPFEFFAVPGRKSIAFQGINSTPLIKRTLSRLRRSIRTPAGRALPLYFTEFDYQTQGRYARYTRPESKRARYAVAAMRLAYRYRVTQMLWYGLIHPPRSLLNGDVWDGAMIQRNGTPESTWKRLVGARRSFGG